MSRKTALVFYYPKVSRYSIHALAGALEVSGLLDSLEIDFTWRADRLADSVARRLDEGRRTVLAISLTTAQRDDMAEVVGAIRELRHGDSLLTVAGGPHPTADPLDALRMGFDTVARGEGERVFPELMERFINGGDWRETPGLARLDAASGALIENAPPAQVNLDDFPPFSAKLQKLGHIEITRGCSFACAFCQVPRLHGARPRHRSLEAILRAAREMRLAGRVDYRFITSNAFGYGSPDGRQLNLDAVRALLSGVRDEVGPDGRIYFGSFPSEVRPEHVNSETVALTRRYADNDNLVLGAQSGSDRMLRLCRRGHTVDQARQAVRSVLDGGLKANVDFIFGLPKETEQDLVATLDFMDELVDMGARIHTHTFMPLPHTHFADAPPGVAERRIRELLDARLVPSGAAYGNWKEQEAIASRLAQSREKKTNES